MVHRLAALALGCVIGMSACGWLPGASSTIDLGEQDAGRQVSVHIGDMVKLKLEDVRPVPGSSLVWSAQSTDRSILALTFSHRDPSSPSMVVGRDLYEADFRAQARGSAEIVARGARTCEAMNPAYCTAVEMRYPVRVS